MTFHPVIAVFLIELVVMLSGFFLMLINDVFGKAGSTVDLWSKYLAYGGLFYLLISVILFLIAVIVFVLL